MVVSAVQLLWSSLRLFVLFTLWLLEARAISVPFALHYIEDTVKHGICCAVCCCIYVFTRIRFLLHSPFLDNLTGLAIRLQSVGVNCARCRKRTRQLNPTERTKRCRAIPNHLLNTCPTLVRARMLRRMNSIRVIVIVLVSAILVGHAAGSSVPTRAPKGMVVSQSEIASRIGADVLIDGGNSVDAAVATAFALAVTHPTAGNIGGGGFLLYRPVTGSAVAYDFREMAPAKASPTMFMKDGKYSCVSSEGWHVQQEINLPGQESEAP
jgi:hypothetical protein